MMSAGEIGAASLGIAIGDIVGDKYRIDALLGAGGMGVVFAAHHITLQGQFALKFLSREGLANTQAIGRFKREAQATAKLKSEHAVRVFDVGTHANGLPYIVMEYLEGGDLGRLLRNAKQLPIAEAIDYLLQTCAAIADAHKAGIIHRDIKPSNLFCVTREDQSLMIKVLDFGISKVTDGLASEAGVTATGHFIGSPSYMSPEQMRAPDRVDLRTDIWSLGVVLYECLTAKLPFPASTLPEICLRVAQDPPIPPSAHRADLPPGLEAVILRCLEKDREKRFPTVNALAEALSEFVEQPVPAKLWQSATSGVGALGRVAPSAARRRTRTASFRLTQPTWARTASTVFARRRSLVLALGGAALVTLMAVVGGVFWYRGTQLNKEISAAVPSQSASESGETPPSPVHVAPEPAAPEVTPVPSEITRAPSEVTPVPSEITRAPSEVTRAPSEVPSPVPPPSTDSGPAALPSAPAPRVEVTPSPPAKRPLAPALTSPAPAGKRTKPDAPSASPPPSKARTKPPAERDANSAIWKR